MLDVMSIHDGVCLKLGSVGICDAKHTLLEVYNLICKGFSMSACLQVHGSVMATLVPT